MTSLCSFTSFSLSNLAYVHLLASTIVIYFCFKGRYSAGKCIPITRGAGIYQEHMNEALEVLSAGGWVLTFLCPTIFLLYEYDTQLARR